MTKEEAIKVMQDDLAAGLLDIESDDELLAKLDSYGLSPEDMVDVLDSLESQGVEKLADVEALNERQADQEAAQQMADEDQTPVTVTEEDTDGDGDPDKITSEKEEPEEDIELSPEDSAALAELAGTAESDNSSETEDKPHEEPKFKNKTNQIAKYLGENRLGGM